MELGKLTEESAIDKPAYKAVAKAHGKFIFRRRIARLASAISTLIPPGAKTVLDVGSGSGEVALAIQQLKPSLAFTGLDVLVRDHTAIPTQSFDGVRLPCADKSFDVVILVDVLHHSREPIPLLSECARVAKTAVIIKDHYSENWFDHAVLRVMDWVGNASHNVRLEYRYFSAAEWDGLYQKASLTPSQTLRRIDLYPFPASLVFERHLHFVSALRPASISEQQ